MGGGRRSSSEHGSSSDTNSSSGRKKKTPSRSKEHQRRRRRRSRSSSGDSASTSRRKHSKKSSRRKDHRRISKSPSVSTRSSGARKSRSVSADRRRQSPSTKSNKSSSRSKRSRSRSMRRNIRSQRSREPRKSRSSSIEEIKIKSERFGDVPSILSLNVKSDDESKRGIVAPDSKAQITTGMSVKLSVAEQLSRSQAIDEINESGFQQRDFKSGRSIATAVNTHNRQIDDHDIVIFGTSAETKSVLMTTTVASSGLVNTIVPDKAQIAHENLYGDQAAKQERWIRRLHSMRQKKLNGEAMT